MKRTFLINSIGALAFLAILPGKAIQAQSVEANQADIMARGQKYGEMQLRSHWERQIYDSVMYQAEEAKRVRAIEIQQQAVRARYSKDSLSYIEDIMDRGQKYGEMQLRSHWERRIYDSVMSHH